jgi:membrane fusion protein (multidrug efflux system)
MLRCNAAAAILNGMADIISSGVSSPRSRLRVFAPLVLVSLLPLISGCGKPEAQAAAEPQAPEVSIITVVPQPRAIVRELPGRIAPTRVADVRPRISGIVVQRMFSQGSEVKPGDPLYQIDPKPFEVELQAAEAALAKADAALEQAAAQARRVALLHQQKAVSEAEYERARGAAKQAEADVSARKVDVAKARLNLDYATIRAPIGGIVGAALVSEGALVVQGESTSLATIQQLDPIYADFTQSVTEMNKLRRSLASGEYDAIAPEVAKVRLVLDDGSIYPFPGKLLFSDARVDAQTGQVTLRGEFANPAKELLPGMYVRVQVEQGMDMDSIAIPQQAVQRNGAGGSEVFVVKNDGLVAIQPVRTASVLDGQWLISEGLKGGEKVVVEGFQKFAPGDKVAPMPWSVAEAAQTASAQKQQSQAKH